MLNFTRLYAQSGSTSKGTEFWTAYMDHVNTATGNSPSKMILYITSDASTSGSVSFADGTATIPFTVTPNTVTFVDIPPGEFLGSAGQFLKGIHVTSLKPIAVYAHIYASNVSGATLLLPVNTLGKNYYSLNYTQKSNANPSYSTFVIVATEDGTQVQITPSAALTTGQAAGSAFVINLQKGEVYQGLSATDLTGTRIQSVSTTTGTCKRIAVFSGSTKLGIGCSAASSLSSDNLFQQVYPTSSWGKNYVTVALMNRPYDIFRIVLSDPATKVTLNGQTVPASSFTNGFYYEFNTNITGTVTNTISADKPVQVVQYTPTQNQTLAANCAVTRNDVGDPEMIYLSPIEQGLDHVTLYATGYYNITQSYINVVIPTSAASSFTLDGVPYATFTPVSGNAAYSYAQIPVTSGPRATGGAGTVTSGTHNIAASQPFNAIAYGFGSTESYGYSAGTNLQDLNEFIKLQDVQTNTISSSGCAGVSYKPRISIPYQTTSISWDLKDGNPPVIDNNPVVVDQTQKGDITIYSYDYSKPIQYNTAGSYTIVATVLNPNSSDCGSTEDVEFDFSVSDIPAANFTVQPSACLNENVTFTDKTDTKGITTKSWAWDFADAANSTSSNPNTASTQNATHTFAKAGDYMVSLTVTNQNGCASTYQQNIHINALPQAGFTYSAPDCETHNVTFTDVSTPGEGTLSKWDWDFGDGTTEASHPSATPFTHQFAAAGTYTVKLTVTSSTSCQNTIAQNVIIHPLPQVDFSLPDACVNDNTQFNNLSTIADHTETQFTYAWDFGDAASGTANASALKNPQHHFTHSGVFTVTLTVTSKDGCSASKSQQFTVNGDTPKADFNVQNNGNLCSADDVLFLDKSTVNFGNITKLVWYFDVDGQPTQSETYTRDQFPADNIYHHNYGPITTATTYHVKLIAYSGNACQSVQTIQSVPVKPSPTVTVATIGPLCQEDSPVQIIATPANGVTGTSTFIGTGVSTSGLFNPTIAGSGTFTINYNFVANNLCTYATTTQVIVHANPTVNVPSEVHLLDGGQVTLNASASGDVPLTYKWTLSNGSKATGLDHDDVAQPLASPSDDITYMLTVTTANNCTKSALVNVVVLKAPVVPNTFTPNNDGINDTWNIKYMDSYPNCTIDVYNRYGEKLYSSIGYPQPWDGTYRGAQLPAATYYYIINPKNGRKVISGSVTIIR